MKKIIRISIAVFAIVLVGTSCKKDSSKPQTPPVSNPLVGYWLGTFNTVNNEGEVFKSDGTTVEYDFFGVASTDTASCPYKGYGTYTLSGNNVNFTVTFPSNNQTFSNVAVLNTSSSPNAISGSYSSSNGGGSGKFSFTKQ